MKSIWKRFILILLVFLAILVCICVGFLFIPNTPRAVWNRSEDVLTLSPRYFEIDTNDLPTVRLWGNGTITWVRYDNQQRRSVFTGQLEPVMMQETMQDFVNSGLATMRLIDTIKASPIPEEDIWIQVNLDGRRIFTAKDSNKLTLEQRNVIDFLETGAGVHGRPFIPTIGYLEVYKVEETEHRRRTTAHHWPEDRFGYSLGILRDKQRQVHGAELLYLWNLVNTQNPPLLESDGQVYLIGLAIPKLSLFLPE